MIEAVVLILIVNLGLIAAGHMIGYHRGWQDGYWTEHPPQSSSVVPVPDSRKETE